MAVSLYVYVCTHCMVVGFVASNRSGQPVLATKCLMPLWPINFAVVPGMATGRVENPRYQYAMSMRMLLLLLMLVVRARMCRTLSEMTPDADDVLSRDLAAVLSVLYYDTTEQAASIEHKSKEYGISSAPTALQSEKCSHHRRWSVRHSSSKVRAGSLVP